MALNSLHSHKGVMLTSVWRPRLVLGKLDKSLERQENRRSCWRFLGQDLLTNSPVRPKTYDNTNTCGISYKKRVRRKSFGKG